MAWDCDSIDWLVDILGTVDLLEAVGECKVFDLSERGKARSELRRSSPNVADGLYFDGSHWYSIKNKIKRDSYKEGYQRPGTAHFCQTFALMIHLGGKEERKLKANDFVKNVEQALQFWLDLFQVDKPMLNYVLNEIHNSSYKDRIPEGQPKTLEKMQAMQLENFLRTAKLNAGNFVGCEQSLG